MAAVSPREHLIDSRMLTTVLARLRRFAGRHVPVASRADVRAIRRSRAAARRRAEKLAVENERLRESMEAETARAGLAECRAGLADRLVCGETLEAAVVGTMRDLLDAGEADEAEAMAHSLADSPGAPPAGRLAVAVTAIARDLPELAYAALARVPPEAWRRHAVAEYLAAVYACDRGRLAGVLRDLLDARDPWYTARTWHDVLRYAYVIRELDLAQRAFTLLVEAAEKSRRVERQLHDRREGGGFAWDEEIEWLRPWVEDGSPGGALPGRDGHTPVALLGYGQPGRAKASQNIGDYVQTLAMLGHLVRRRDVRFHGDADLVELADDLRKRVRPDRLLDGPGADVDLLVASRDASTYESYPEGTWIVLFGWYLHPVFGLQYEFPMHPNLRPIIVSFHCSKREMLTPEAIEYLRRHGPVGCRDWTTVDLLLSVGVPAFFSGCLTATIDTLFPAASDTRPEAEPATVYVDVPRDEVPSGAATVRHSYRGVKRRGFVPNVREAVALLDRYQGEFTDVVTSRLHCYLPARALGLQVDFRPKNRADRRFNGLIDTDDAAFDETRNRLLERLETVLAAVLDGRPAHEVYRLWREACAGDVAAARARHTAIEPLGPPTLDVAGVVARARDAEAGDAPAPAAHVAVLATPDLAGPLGTTLGGLWAGAADDRRDVRVWLLGRGWTAKQVDELAAAVPWIDLRHVRCDEMPPGAELLLLPGLLPGVQRVTVLPSTAAVLGDVRELAAFDLGGQPVAARTAVGPAARKSGFGLLYSAASRLGDDAAAAADLYRRIPARHRFDFDAFDTDVVVVDLDRMRVDGFTAGYLPYFERFGLTAREALNLYAGPDRAHLPAEWAYVPTREWIAHPKLVHWAGGAQPWLPRYVAGRAYWRRADEVACSRRHAWPETYTMSSITQRP